MAWAVSDLIIQFPKYQHLLRVYTASWWDFKLMSLTEITRTLNHTAHTSPTLEPLVAIVLQAHPPHPHPHTYTRTFRFYKSPTPNTPPTHPHTMTRQASNKRKGLDLWLARQLLNIHSQLAPTRNHLTAILTLLTIHLNTVHIDPISKAVCLTPTRPPLS